MAVSSNNLLDEYELNALEVMVRVFFYYLTILVVLVFLQLTTVKIFTALFQNFANPLFLVVNSIRGLTGIVGILITMAFLSYDKKSLKWAGFTWTPRGMVVILIGIITTILGVFVSAFIEQGAQIIDLDRAQLLQTPDILLTMLVTMIGVAIGEEVIYRGYIHKYLETILPFWPAALLSSFIFGFTHFYVGIVQKNLIFMITWGIAAAVFGLGMAIVYRATHYNLLLAIIIHGCWDISFFIFQIEFDYNTTTQMVWEIIAQSVGTFIFVALSIVLYNKLAKKRDK